MDVTVTAHVAGCWWRAAGVGGPGKMRECRAPPHLPPPRIELSFLLAGIFRSTDTHLSFDDPAWFFFFHRRELYLPRADLSGRTQRCRGYFRQPVYFWARMIMMMGATWLIIYLSRG